MASLRNALFLLIITAQVPVFAAVSAADLPDTTVWYVHANLAEMRATPSGQPLYDWLDAEVFEDIRDEVGIDVGKEVESITAFSSTGDNTVIVIDGNFSSDFRDKTVAIATLKSTLEILEHKGTTYYHARNMDRSVEIHAGDNDEDSDSDSDSDDPLHDLDEEAFFVFIGDDRLVVTSREGELKSMIDNGGRIAGSGSHDGAIFVLTADKTFVQAGLRTDDLASDEDGWQSNIVRNTEQAAVLISELNERLAIEAQLVSREPAMAQSIGGIVNGLIGLQAFNDELDQKIRDVLNSTRVKVEENILSVTTVLDASLIVSFLDD
jgi:hypothetical protein